MRLWRNEKEVLKLIAFVSPHLSFAFKPKKKTHHVKKEKKKHTSNSILSGVVLLPNFIP